MPLDLKVNPLQRDNVPEALPDANEAYSHAGIAYGSMPRSVGG